jgi:hypothetical protein
MATARSTSRRKRLKEQRLLHLCATGKLFPPDKKKDGHIRGHLFVLFFIFTSLP